MEFMSLVTVFTLIFSITGACFITNCPPGGKRSLGSSAIQENKQCKPCGPPGLGGRCFGPDICCGPEIGCQMKNWMSSVCQTENLSMKVCKNEGKTCAKGRGTCALEGICCTNDSCFADTKYCARAEDFMSMAIERKWPNSLE